jgi:Response regulators consisting of a CheY-like receiver domain and a winged-helix DNA-binding domain
MSQDKILVVDNEMEIIQLLRLYLSREGYNVVWTTDSSKALSLTQEEKPDLILLDIVMPGLSGLEVCSKIREHCVTPILFISCKGEDIDKVLGFSIGGDDYITKPFSPAELVARVKAHLRRQNMSSINDDGYLPQNAISFDQIVIDLNAHTVSVCNQLVHLTAKEFDLLVLLCKYPNRVFTPKQIFSHLWDSYGIEEDFRTVMVHISNIRKKIEADPEHPKYIHTVRGVGYKFVDSLKKI